MNSQISIQTALCLPAPDIEALIQGRMIAAIPRIFINPGKLFALYPSHTLINVPPEKYYRSNFLPTAKKKLGEFGSETVLIKAWAKCEFCQVINESESLNVLSQLTVWTEEALQQNISQRGHIFLAYLRVYRLPQPVGMPVSPSPKFISLKQTLTVNEITPIVSDRLFTQRRRQLEKLEPPLHPELEELQAIISQVDVPAAQQLDEQIKQFLGWTKASPTTPPNPDLAWIKTITELGERSKELDTGKSNYQAGTDFEQIVHKSLTFLGFGVDPNAKGGAGGMDLYCTTPYPLVGECKAGKSIPDSTVEQLDRIGKRHLGREDYEIAVKLIIGPGEPTKYLKTSADVSIISIINPMTLQKLVELQAKYPGSINLIELKSYLKAGQIDTQIDEYIEKVQKKIKLRSHIIKLVKNYLEKTGFKRVSVHALHGAYAISNPPVPLKPEALHEILIELSSPLTGYLGRNKGRDGSDRFYFLRELQV